MRQAAWEEMFTPPAPPVPEPTKRPFRWSSLMLLSWEEWVTFIVVFIVFMTVVESLDNANWVAEMPSLYPIAFLGLGVGVVLAKTPLPEAVAHMLGIAFGILGVVVASTARLDGSLTARVSELYDRMHAWSHALTTGGISNDNVPFVVLVVALTYLTAYISVWGIYRWYNAWVGLIPGGLALLTNISYLPGQRSFPLLVYLFGSILLISRMHVLRNARGWKRSHIVYPDLLSLQVLNVTIWVAVVLLGLAWMMPVAKGGGVFLSLWDTATAPIAKPFGDMQRLFSAVDSKRGGAIHKFGSTMPLQGKVTLGGGQIMSVTTTEPVFLKAQTYDYYTAAGWRIGPNTSITTSSWPALKALETPEQARAEFRRPVSIDVTNIKQSNVIFSVGQPLAVSIDSRVVFGADPADVTSVRPARKLKDGSEYRVDGTISAASPGRLRQAGTNYPAWITPYLQLPDSLPAAVRQKAQEIAGSAPTAYDKATAIESFIRTYAIDTNIPPAPANKDSVAYFLFEADRGYFDYHASAMVVMLRALGVPARIAVGYVLRPQDRQPDTNVYSVSEANAFAWPEVYFPELGWIDFNPTPSVPPVARPGNEDQSLAQEDPLLLPEDTQNPADIVPPTEPAQGPLDQLQSNDQSHLVSNILMGIVLTLVGVTVVGGALFQFVWQRGLGGLDYATQTWEKTNRLARWSRIRGQPQQTPREYAQKLQEQLPDVKDVGYIGQAYAKARYGRKELAPDEKERLTAVWRNVRNRLLSRLLRWK